MMNIADLSFVAMRDCKTLPKAIGRQLARCFWNVKPTGDYCYDCRMGRNIALEYLAFEEEDDGGGFLAHIVADIPRELTGIEISFLQLVCFQAKAGHGEARRISNFWDRRASA